MKEERTPKVVHSLGWTAAAIAAFVFAASAGVFAYRAISQPISAQSVTSPVASSGSASNCAPENTFAINNYAPELQAIPGGHAKIEGMLGGNYRCSSICVPGTKPDKAAVKDYVTKNVTVGGEKVNVVDTGTEFLKIAETNNPTTNSMLAKTVIIDSTKRACLGGTPGATTGNSVDYTSLQAGGKNIVLAPNETAKQITAQKHEEFKIGTTGGSANSQTGAPSASGLPSAPTGTVSGPGPVKSDAPATTSSADLNTTKANLLTCQTQLHDNLVAFQGFIYPNGDTSKTATQPRYSSFYNDYLQSYTAMNSKYAQAALTDLKTAQTGLNWCSGIKSWATVSITALNNGTNTYSTAPTESQSTDFNSAKANFMVCETRLYDNLNQWMNWVYPSGDVTKTPTQPKYVDFYNAYRKSYVDLNTNYDQATTLDQAQQGLNYCNSITSWVAGTIASDNASGGTGAPTATAQTTVVAGQTVTAEATATPTSQPWTPLKRVGVGTGLGLAGAIVGGVAGTLLFPGPGSIAGAALGTSIATVIGAGIGAAGGVISSLFMGR